MTTMSCYQVCIEAKKEKGKKMKEGGGKEMKMMTKKR
jgi:hypothetical protein